MLHEHPSPRVPGGSVSLGLMPQSGSKSVGVFPFVGTVRFSFRMAAFVYSHQQLMKIHVSSIQLHLM